MLMPLTYSFLHSKCLTGELILFSVLTEWHKMSVVLLHSIIQGQNFLPYLSSSCARVSQLISHH